MSELRLEPNAARCDDRQFMGDSGRKGAVVELDTRVERQDAGIRGTQVARWRLVVVGILARPGHAIGDAEMARQVLRVFEVVRRVGVVQLQAASDDDQSYATSCLASLWTAWSSVSIPFPG